MEDQVLALLRQLCSPTQGEEVLGLLCANACAHLTGLLAPGVTAEDCPEQFKLAAAWLAMDWLREGDNWSGITSLSAGDMTVRREEGQGTGELRARAMELMAPYLQDRGFVFRGVRG